MAPSASVLFDLSAQWTLATRARETVFELKDAPDFNPI